MNRYILPIIVVAVLIFALFKLNGGMSKNAEPDHDDDDQQQSQTDNSKKPETAPTQAPSTPAQASASAPDEVIVGDPSKAKYKITAGWSYDPSNQADSSHLTSTINTLQQYAKSSNGQVSVQIVDVDVPAEQRSSATKGIQDVGIQVNGKPMSQDNLGEGNSAPEAVTAGIAHAMPH